MNSNLLYNGFRFKEIDDPEKLFVRNQPRRELEKLVYHLTVSRHSVELIGEKRFGKSSILRCAKKQIETGNDRKELIPVFIRTSDKSHISGHDEGHSLVSAYMLDALYKNNNFDLNNYKLDGYDLTNEKTILGHYNEILNHKMYGLDFFEYLITYFENEGILFVLLFDEYEHLFLETFGQNNNKPIAAISSLVKSDLLIVCFAGSRTSEHFKRLKIDGSPDFNCAVDTIFLQPLTIDDCRLIIEDGIENSKIPSNLKNHDINDQISKVYDLSGGCPNLIKHAGHVLLNHGETQEEIIFRRSRTQLAYKWDYLSPVEQECILNRSKPIQDLLDLCLIDHSSRPIGRLWAMLIDYETEQIEENKFNDKILNKGNIIIDWLKNKYIALEKIDKVKWKLKINSIHSLLKEEIDNLNEQCEFQNIPLVINYPASHKFTTYMGRLNNLCFNKPSFKEFILDIYRIIFESSQGNVYVIDNG